LTIPELCAVAYVLLLERLERQVSALTSGAVVARAIGSDVDIPMIDDVRAEFDAWLCSEPELVDPDMATMRYALGLPAGR
jgi:hypothetical protein